MAEGIAEGAKKEKLENARRMKELNIDIHTISQVTGLSTGEIEKL
jgi:predicted transposase YdaD